MVYMWRSEDSSESVLSLSSSSVGPRDQTYIIEPGDTFTHWTIVPANFGFLG